ncbi:unnamed protein product [Sphagnum tenellum]
MRCCSSAYQQAHEYEKGTKICSPDLEAKSDWEVILEKLVCYETPPFVKYHDIEGRVRRRFGLHDVLILEFSSGSPGIRSWEAGITESGELIEPKHADDDEKKKRLESRPFLIKAEKVGRRGKNKKAAIRVKDMEDPTAGGSNIPENALVKFMLHVRGKPITVGTILNILENHVSPDFNIFNSNCWTYANQITKDLFHACTDPTTSTTTTTAAADGDGNGNGAAADDDRGGDDAAASTERKEQLAKELKKVPGVCNPKQLFRGCIVNESHQMNE